MSQSQAVLIMQHRNTMLNTHLHVGNEIYNILEISGTRKQNRNFHRTVHVTVHVYHERWQMAVVGNSSCA